MKNHMHAGMILSKEEGKEALAVVYGAHEAGYIDAPTAFEMSMDVLMRTIPDAS